MRIVIPSGGQGGRKTIRPRPKCLFILLPSLSHACEAFDNHFPVRPGQRKIGQTYIIQSVDFEKWRKAIFATVNTLPWFDRVKTSWEVNAGLRRWKLLPLCQRGCHRASTIERNASSIKNQFSNLKPYIAHCSPSPKWGLNERAISEALRIFEWLKKREGRWTQAFRWSTNGKTRWIVRNTELCITWCDPRPGKHPDTFSGILSAYNALSIWHILWYSIWHSYLTRILTIHLPVIASLSNILSDEFLTFCHIIWSVICVIFFHSIWSLSNIRSGILAHVLSGSYLSGIPTGFLPDIHPLILFISYSIWQFSWHFVFHILLYFANIQPAISSDMHWHGIYHLTDMYSSVLLLPQLTLYPSLSAISSGFLIFVRVRGAPEKNRRAQSSPRVPIRHPRPTDRAGKNAKKMAMTCCAVKVIAGLFVRLFLRVCVCVCLSWTCC